MTVEATPRVQTPATDLAERQKRIEAFATWVNEDADAWPGAVVTLVLTAWAHNSLRDQDLIDAFDDYREQVEIYDDLEACRIGWYDIEPDLTGPDRDLDAEEIQRGNVQDALKILLHGK